MSLKTYGAVSHSVCMAYFLSKGWSVNLPLFDDTHYDLIVDDGLSLIKVQCKTANGNRGRKNGSKYYPRCALRNIGHRQYRAGDFDFLWILSRGDPYLIPFDALPKNSDETLQRTIVLSPKYNTFLVDLPFVIPAGQRTNKQTIPITDLEGKRIESLYAMSESPRTIAMIMGLTQAQVESYIQRHGVNTHKMTPEMKEDVVRLYLDEDMSVKAIAMKLGFSLTTVGNIITERKISKRPTAIKPEWKPEIVEMARSGKSNIEIAEHFGIRRPNTVASFLHKHKWLVKEQSV